MNVSEIAKKTEEMMEYLKSVQALIVGGEEDKGPGIENSLSSYDLEELKGMSLKQLYDACVSAGITVQKQGKSKDYYIQKLQKKGLVVSVDEEESPEMEEKTEYEGKNAVDLYRLCVSRGIAATKKKSPAYYISLLKEDDEKKKDDDDEDWKEESADDWAEEEKTEKRGRGALAGKASAKKTKAKEPEEDWNID